MIASLRGKVQGRTGGSAIIDVNGVGYLVNASSRTLEGLGDVGDEVFLVIVTAVREDAITLYGFTDVAERDVFNLLTTVQGIGPKAGLAILSVLSADEVLGAIVGQDDKSISRANGVGPKTAKRVIAELGDKAAAMGGIAGAAGTIVVSALAGEDDAKQALLGLGYSKMEVEGLMQKVRAEKNAPIGAAAIVTACLRLAGNS